MKNDKYLVLIDLRQQSFYNNYDFYTEIQFIFPLSFLLKFGDEQKSIYLPVTWNTGDVFRTSKL